MLTRFASILSVCLVAACATDAPTDDPAADADVITSSDPSTDFTADAPGGWSVTPTLHLGARVFDHASAAGRNVHPLWIAGTKSSPMALTITATAADTFDVRIAVLGPLKNGKRDVLASDGYGSRKTTATVSPSIDTTGEHLVVIGSYRLENETAYDVVVRCASNATCDDARVDVLASPKAGALVAMETGGVVSATLGAVLDGRDFDVELELWASPPGQSWNATQVATGVASGNQVNVIVPRSVKAGDDLSLVVREAGGRVLDSGVITRYAPDAVAFARTDSIMYGDLVSLDIGGVVGFFEGSATMQLRSEQRGGLLIDERFLYADMPGMVGNGFNKFDVTFAPEIFDAQGSINPNLPSNGELLSLGFVNGNGEYRRLGCFEYCNDLSGMETCTGGTRACPAP